MTEMDVLKRSQIYLSTQAKQPSIPKKKRTFTKADGETSKTNKTHWLN